MWTDEQLLEQGWSQEQIAQYRIEQEIETTPKEIEVPEATVEAEPEIQTPIVEPSSTTVDQPGISGSSLFQDKTQTILIVCMMVIAPLSLYGVFTGGPEGPSGVSGEQGENGTAGSSFHLVQNSADLPTCDESINNQIFFVADDYGFEVCQNQAWSIINLTGLQGEPGQDGADGNEWNRWCQRHRRNQWPRW